jgi:hypothetical protein
MDIQQEKFTAFCWLASLIFEIGMVAGSAKAQGYVSESKRPNYSAYDYQAMNSTSPLESAGSHGTSGYSIGIGQIRVVSRVEGSIPQTLDESEKADSLTDWSLPSVWVTKGLIWPFDIGATYGHDAATAVTRMGGYLQWSVYQEFRLPALAIRAERNILDLQEIAKVESSVISAITSWGYGPITVSAAAAGERIKLSNLTQENTSTDVAKIDHPPTESLLQPRARYSIGAIVRIPSTLITVAAESAFIDPQARTYAAKVAYGM